MNGDDQIPRSRLYELLVQVDRKLAVVENRVARIEEQMDRQLAALENQLKTYESRSTVIIAVILAVLAIAGITMLFLLLSGRI